ncbi:MAG: oxygenase MpaB family protein [Verrucomicrobiota bacterium JB022]|nr:oxygenase MpaB family protein [Verrucomicrobiota bacterium JB022]
MSAVHRNMETPADGAELPDWVFGPGSAMWEVGRELALLVGGPAAATLQTAHPGIALGVARHSRFRENAFHRLRHTLTATWTVGFGTKAEAARVREEMAAIHRRITGPEGARRPQVQDPREGQPDFPLGQDHELQFWVLATLIQGSIEGYERVHGSTTPELRERYYREMQTFGTYFGLPERYGPPDWEAFQVYYQRMIHEPWMASLPECSEIAEAVALPPKPWWAWLAMRPNRFLLAEFLPRPLDAKLGFSSTRWTRFQRRVLDWLLPRMVPLLPAPLRYPPHYLKARKRAKRAGQM